MAELSEVSAAIESLEIAGLPREKITLLHCTTEYPAPIHDVNLRAMDAMASSRAAFLDRFGPRALRSLTPKDCLDVLALDFIQSDVLY